MSSDPFSATVLASEPSSRRDLGDAVEEAALLPSRAALSTIPGTATIPPEHAAPPKFVSAPSREPRAPAPSCAICLEQYAPGDVVSLMPCLHGFHEQCLTQWLGIKAQCPVCKASLKALLRSCAHWGGT